MKKNFLKIMLACLFATLLPFVAWAQSTDSADEESENQESSAIVDDFRPEMPRLFYTGEQRRILEAVRQDVIDEENFDDEDFVPLIIQQEQANFSTSTPVDRQETISIDSFVRNRKTGKGVWWSKGQEHEFHDEEEKGALGRESGIVEFQASSEDGGSLIGIDTFNKTRFILKVGQQLAPDGEISETYPVVIKNNE